MQRAAVALDMPYTSFRDRVVAGEIAYVKVGGGRHRERRHFLLEDLRRWATWHRVPANWEIEPSEKRGTSS